MFWGFFPNIIVVNSKISIQLVFCSVYFFARPFVFISRLFTFTTEHGYKSCFKGFGPLNIEVSPSVSTCSLSSPEIAHILLVLFILGNFVLYSEHFEYYIMKLRVLLKSSGGC